MIALATVHTTGVNWESLAIIIGSVVASLAFLIGLQERRASRIRDDITNAVNHLSEVLMAKLETKEKVAELQEHIARLNGVVGDLRSSNDKVMQLREDVFQLRLTIQELRTESRHGKKSGV